MVYHFFRPLGTWLPQGNQVPNGNLVDRNYRNNHALAVKRASPIYLIEYWKSLYPQIQDAVRCLGIRIVVEG